VHVPPGDALTVAQFGQEGQIANRPDRQNQARRHARVACGSNFVGDGACEVGVQRRKVGQNGQRDGAALAELVGGKEKGVGQVVVHGCKSASERWSCQTPLYRQTYFSSTACLHSPPPDKETQQFTILTVVTTSVVGFLCNG